jgi:tetratricopeptide (TPR) repeat protein
MKIGAFFVGLLVIMAVVSRPLLAQDNSQRENFARAYAFYVKGDSARAKEFFSNARDAKFRLADYSLYYLGLIAFNEANWDESRQLLTQLRRRYPQSIWFYPAALQCSKIDIAEKQYADAVDALQALRGAQGAKNEVVQEATYLLAQTYEAQENYALAYSLYRDLRDQFPNSRWTPAARKDQARLRNKFPDLFGLTTVQGISDEADRLTRERGFGDAEILYKKLINTVTEPDSRLGYLAKLGALYLASGKRDEAIPLLNLIAREFPDSSEAPKALYQIGQTLWNRHENAKAIEYLKIVLDKYPASAYSDRAQYASADIYDYFGQRDEAIHAYNRVVTQFPDSRLRGDCLDLLPHSGLAGGGGWICLARRSAGRRWISHPRALLARPEHRKHGQLRRSQGSLPENYKNRRGKLLSRSGLALLAAVGRRRRGDETIGASCALGT